MVRTPRDNIILAPPTFISATEGNAVSVPCVGLRGTSPTFSSDGLLVNSSQYSLNFASIAAASAGNYTCQVEDSTTNFTVNVTVIGETVCGSGYLN